MSAAKDEADAGPEFSTDDAESDPRSGKRGEEQSDQEINIPKGTGTVPHDGEEISSSVAGDIEFNDYVQPSQSTDIGGLDPISTERPSSADGSLSIPDDTPSLQVAPHAISPTPVPY